MKNGKKIFARLCMVWMVGMMALPAAAEELTTTAQEPAAAEAQDESSVTGTKAVAAAVTIAAAATAGALAMGWSISKSSEAIARQPEAAGNIRSSLMLGLVFIETAIIYALIVAILIIFVL